MIAQMPTDDDLVPPGEEQEEPEAESDDEDEDYEDDPDDDDDLEEMPEGDDLSGIGNEH